MLCQLDGSLTAKLNNAGVGLSVAMMLSTALGVQRVEIQAVAGVEVGGDRLGVVVDEDSLTAVLLEGPDAVDRAVVELDALTDADGAGTEDEDFLFLGLALLGGLGLLLRDELGGFVVAS